MDWVRLSYSSKLRYEGINLRGRLMELLDDAVDFNYRHQISGVLYYGDGYFFQCIEGERKAIEEVYYERIVPSTTHDTVKLIGIEPIEQKSFSQWSMKFALRNVQLREFFNMVSNSKFNPDALNEKTRKQFLDILKII